MSNLDTRLADELIRSLRPLGLKIYIDYLLLMPLPWLQQLARCLQARVELRERLDIRYRNYQSAAEFSKDADLTQELDIERGYTSC